jgi:hypothetical protein
LVLKICWRYAALSSHVNYKYTSLFEYLILIWNLNKNKIETGHQWFTPVTLSTWQAEIRVIEVWANPQQVVHETIISTFTRAKWTVSVAQVVEWLFSSGELWVQFTVSPKKRKTSNNIESKLTYGYKIHVYKA